jgi:hypothetical protein
MRKKMANIQDERKHEAEKIYKAIFKKDTPPLIKDRFHRAAKKFQDGFSEKEKKEYEQVLNKVSDLEALELAARFKGKIPLLVSQVRLMVHLAETLPENQHFFVSFRNKRISGFFSLCVGGMRSFFKWVKGWFLLRRIKDA